MSAPVAPAASWPAAAPAPAPQPAALPPLAVLGIGLLGPGLPNWAEEGAARLRDPARWERAPTAVPVPQRLPANERRRAGTVVKAALAVADEALAMAGLAPAELATVFTSASGDPVNCHALLEALAQAPRVVSPTRFTNSVHNASAGYWHIATQAMTASVSLAAFDASFGAGLLEAAAQCAATPQRAVLLVAVDVPYPAPLDALRPIADVFAVALVLASVHEAPAAGGAPRTSPPPRAAGAGIDPDATRLRLRAAPEHTPTPCADARLEALRVAVPAARALPLLQRLAEAAGGDGAPPPAVVVEVAEGLAFDVMVQPGRRRASAEPQPLR